MFNKLDYIRSGIQGMSETLTGFVESGYMVEESKAKLDILEKVLSLIDGSL